jgi:hypothetical protein
MKISFLHTSKSHISRFDKIVKEFSNSITVSHYVNEELLVAAQKEQQLDKVGFDKMVNQIQKDETEIIICTCSTYGELCKESDGVYRIDKPIGEYIVSNYKNIGIAFTSKSTKKISKKLIERIASLRNKRIKILEIDCSNCWHWFMEDNIKKYEEEIANTIRSQFNEFDVVFLAQASMQGAQIHLNNEDYKVVSSPAYGVKKYIEGLRE